MQGRREGVGSVIQSPEKPAYQSTRFPVGSSTTHAPPWPPLLTGANGSGFYNRAMDAWAYRHGVQLEFIRPGKPVENGYIESFEGRLCDEGLNVHVFFSLADDPSEWHA